MRFYTFLTDFFCFYRLNLKLKFRYLVCCPALVIPVLAPFMLNAQHFPDELHLSTDGKRLQFGNMPYTGFYTQSVIREIQLDFPQSQFWDDLENNYSTHDNLPASMTLDGMMYDSVGVRFKGATSYTNSNDYKKSFNITLNAYIPGTDISGYNILNLNNGYNDPSFMRELLYEYLLSRHVPAAKGNFVHLYLNGDNWGIYGNVQQLNKDFVKEWWQSDDGALWRAKRPDGSPAPHGTRGDSLRTLYYLGPDTMQYVNNYDLKFSHIPDPYTRLRDFCYILDTVSQSHMEEVLNRYLDVDRTLWFLAGENVFGDDDSYVDKGRSDYYIYYEAETGRIVPIEMDGNDTFDPSKYNYSIFSHANKPNYALLYKLLNQTQLRQRYLAHMRTLVNDVFDTSFVFPLIDNFYNLIDPVVQTDTVQNYTYSDFLNDKTVLKNFIIDRKNYILSNSEINRNLPIISNTMFSIASAPWIWPEAGEPVSVTTHVTCTDGIDHVYLQYSPSISGAFQKIEMYDDGLHADSLSGDGTYGAEIPGMPGTSWVRFYIQAVSGNSAHTVSFDPEGAEHDVFAYRVKPAFAADTSAVINEIMAKNIASVSDSLGRHPDWIELYNRSSVSTDISGFFLSDDSLNLIKWEFPSGTILPPDGYLIVWADDDEEMQGMHTNFNLSASGDEVWLLNNNRELVDKVEFGPQAPDISFARIPNGTGAFISRQPTFDYNNNPVPVAGFTEDINTGCNPLTVHFTNQSQIATEFHWDFGDGDTSDVISPVHTYLTDGIFTVRLVAGIYGITDTAISQNLISVTSAPPFSFGADTIYSPTVTYDLIIDSVYSSCIWSSSDTSRVMEADTSGLYCVTVFDQNGCSDSACVYLVLNTLESNGNSLTGLRIFPNPADDICIIELPTDYTFNGEVKIYDVTARVKTTMYGRKLVIPDISDWENGVYYIRAGKLSGKLIIQK